MTGEKVLNMPEIHDLTITSIAYIEERSYLITASKDHTSKHYCLIINNSHFIVKVWNRNGLLHSIKGHMQSITGILVPPPSCHLPPETPYFLSCSMDGAILLWNAESGHCEYRNETTYEWLGMRWLSGTSLLSFAHNGVWIWSITQSFGRFTNIL